VEDWSFGFDHLLHDVPQETVYDTCARYDNHPYMHGYILILFGDANRDIVDNVVQGYNGTILCYGQTGAGKTYTMNGGAADYKSRGIIPRAISHIFRTAATSSSDVEVLVRVSYLEIYNEMFYDLLARPTDAPLDNSDLAVREDEDGQVIVKGLTRRPVDSEEAALNMLFEGETNRSIASHDMNAASTRSHCIFTIWLESRSRIGASEKVMHSKLNLVDLAGSERVGKTGSTGSTLAEAKYINKSLTFLEQVVVALGQSARDHIPFRQSKLTNVLRDSLGGNCKTRLIANIWCERMQLEETISTLKFATRMMRYVCMPH
jgi:kinesin family protein 6/9